MYGLIICRILSRGSNFDQNSEVQRKHLGSYSLSTSWMAAHDCRIGVWSQDGQDYRYCKDLSELRKSRELI